MTTEGKDLTRDVLAEFDEKLEQYKQKLFDYPRLVARPLGEIYWSDQAKDLFRFSCELVHMLHVIECKLEKFGKEVERVQY